MMAKKDMEVLRPSKTTEYTLRFGSTAASKGWADFKATANNALADAWDHLVRHPEESSERCYPLKGKHFGSANFGEHSYVQWQYKVTDGGRIWYIVVPASKKEKGTGTVIITRCSTSHPKETDS